MGFSDFYQNFITFSLIFTKITFNYNLFQLNIKWERKHMKKIKRKNVIFETFGLLPNAKDPDVSKSDFRAQIR